MTFIEDWRGTNYIETNSTNPTQRDKVSFILRVTLGIGLAVGIQRFSKPGWAVDALVYTIGIEAADQLIHRKLMEATQYEEEVVHLCGIKPILRGIQLVALEAAIMRAVQVSSIPVKGANLLVAAITSMYIYDKAHRDAALRNG